MFCRVADRLTNKNNAKTALKEIKLFYFKDLYNNESKFSETKFNIIMVC